MRRQAGHFAARVKAEAERSGSLYITERWLGGLLTNVITVKKQIRRMKELEAGSEAGGDFENYTKKEQLMLSREREKLFNDAMKTMTRDQPMDVVLLPMKGDLPAANAFWQLSRRTGGSYVVPSRDWP